MTTGHAPRTRVDRAALVRLLVLLALAFVPWTLVAGRSLTFVFPFGLLDSDPWFFVRVDDYLRFSRGGRFAYIDAWLIGSVLYALALVSALFGTVGFEDRRLTAGLLVVAAMSQFPLAVGFSRRPEYVGVPLGSVLLLAAAWWFYGRDVRAWVGARTE